MIELFKNNNFECAESDNSLVIFNDCLETLNIMVEKSVDLIFADSPYNLGKDFGNNSDSWKDRKEYLNWCYTWIDACFRVLKDGGTFYLMNSTQNMDYISVYLQEHYNIVNDIVWVYDSGVQAKTKYTFNYEDILVEAKTGAKRGLID